MSSVLEKAIASRKASLELAKTSTEAKNNALERIAEAIESGSGRILDANKKDLEGAKKLLDDGGLTKALYERLELSQEKVSGMAESVRSVAELADPSGRVVGVTELDKGLEL
ncbi:MAG: gamma-glutamyl-phosphate reductase, partial [Candidatus Altiarchaeota archaeon]